MKKSTSTQKLQNTINEIKEISKLDYLLYSKTGKRIAATIDYPEGLEELVVPFVDSMAETQIVQGWLYCRIDLNEGTEYVLLCSTENSPDYAFVIGKMAAAQICTVLVSMQEPLDKTIFLRQLISGEIPKEKIPEKCHQLQMKTGKFALFLVWYREDADSIIPELLRNLFVDHYMDFLIDLDGSRMVLFKNLDHEPGMDFQKYARMIVDNLQAEAMENVWVAYGDAVNGYETMRKAYMDACSALEIGKVFYSAERVFDYGRLGIGRLIHALPLDLCEIFLKEVLGENAQLDLDEETLTTITQLFDNNLNISETARQLYIHRNTLVYRLERIEKRLGLDIRSFEDAMIFKLAMLVRLHVDGLKRENPL